MLAPKKDKKGVGLQVRPALGHSSLQILRESPSIRVSSPTPNLPPTPGGGKGPRHVVVPTMNEAFQAMKDLLAIPVQLIPREGRPPHWKPAPTPLVSSSRGKLASRPLQQFSSPRHRSPICQRSLDPRHRSPELHRERSGSHLQSPNTRPWSPERRHRSLEHRKFPGTSAPCPRLLTRFSRVSDLVAKYL